MPDAPPSVPPGSTHDMACGARCLWLVAHHYNREASLEEIMDMAGTDVRSGTSVKGIIRAALQLRLSARVVKGSLENVLRCRRAAILLVRTNSHYILLLGGDHGQVTYVDGVTKRTVARRDFETMWDGVAIVVGDLPARHTYASLWYVVPGILAVTVCLALLWIGLTRQRVARKHG